MTEQSKPTIEQLKARAYDCIEVIEAKRLELQALTAQIAKHAQAQKIETTPIDK